VFDDSLIAPAPRAAPVPGPAAPAARSRPAAPRIRTLPGVYAPQEDSLLLASVLASEPLDGARVLDLCTGSGLLAATAARHGAQVAAVDVSRRAVLTARMTLRRFGCRGEVRRGDLLDAAPDGTWDLVVSNPPYVPAREDDLPRAGARRAWDAGRSGRAILDAICAAAPARLRPGGSLLLVHSEVADVDLTLRRLRDQGLEVEVAARQRIPFGPVMQRRAEALRRAGRLRPGATDEELVVVRGRRAGE
jgi:release factor glutamine methyltransferase